MDTEIKITITLTPRKHGWTARAESECFTTFGLGHPTLRGAWDDVADMIHDHIERLKITQQEQGRST